MFPDMIGFFADRFSEIFDPSKEGSTGNFRIEQREAYFKMFLERPMFGWTFEGFEMSNPLVDWWPEKTGQHFHEGYMEMLFYHGIVGLLFKYSFLIYLFFRMFSRQISQESIILLAFSLSGLLFSLNYVLPLIFWGHVGMCLFYLEQDRLASRAKRMEIMSNQGHEQPQLALSGQS
jgi:O-antigen ligase